MKLYVSKNGIADSVQTAVSDTKSNLNSAKYCRLYCPSGFAYSSYISNLYYKIGNYYNETTYIYNGLVKSERKYTSCYSNQNRKIDNIKEINLPNRIGISTTN